MRRFYGEFFVVNFLFGRVFVLFLREMMCVACFQSLGAFLPHLQDPVFDRSKYVLV